MKSLFEVTLITSFLVIGAWHQLQKSQGGHGLQSSSTLILPAPPSPKADRGAAGSSEMPSQLKLKDEAMARIKAFTSLKQFLELRIGGEARGLVEAMVEDEFESGNPFLSLASIQPLTVILSKGVREVNRAAYRSPEFLRSFGYDMVRYEITHMDNTRSLVMAYREKTNNNQVGIGREDQRPVFAYFATPFGETHSQVSIYRNGSLERLAELPNEEAWSTAGQKVNQAVQLLSSR